MPNKVDEIEKRYLVLELPDLSNIERQETVDVYFPEITPHAKLRARKQKGKFMLTRKNRKQEHDRYVMEEQNIEITEEEFEFFYQTSNRRIEKVRYYYPHESVIIEIDVFSGKLDGLLIAEVEFKTLEELKNFTPPKWLGKEIHKEILANGVLSGKIYEEIRGELEQP